jgi:hypothetical protein
LKRKGKARERERVIESDLERGQRHANAAESCVAGRERETSVSPRALKKIKFNSLLSLSSARFSAALSGCLCSLSRAHSVNPRSPEGRGGFAAPSGGRPPDRPLRCSASSAPRRLFFVATSRTLCDVAEGTPASVCALQLSARSNVVIFRLSLSLSLKTHVHMCGSLSLCLSRSLSATGQQSCKINTTATTVATNPPAATRKTNVNLNVVYLFWRTATRRTAGRPAGCCLTGTKTIFLFSLFASEFTNGHTDRQTDRHAEAVVGRNHFAPGGASFPVPPQSSSPLPSPLPEESTLL